MSSKTQCPSCNSEGEYDGDWDKLFCQNENCRVREFWT